MASRSMWSGSISFGLVNVPVKLFTAVQQKEVHFHLLHDKDGGRIKQKRICGKDGEEVDYEHIAKGYELAPERYVMVTPEELEAFDPESTRSIDIEDFVALEEIDPIYWDHNYYLVPDKGAEKAYVLLFEAMRRSQKVGIARVVLRTKQYLCTLRPMGKGLVLSTMQYADEIVSQTDLKGMPTVAAKPKDRELEMAEQLIRSLTVEFKPEKYKDEYREKVLALIKRKSAGEEIVEPPGEKKAAGRVVNLMEALRASLDAAKPGGAGDAGPERKPPHAARPRPTTKHRVKARAKKRKSA